MRADFHHHHITRPPHDRTARITTSERFCFLDWKLSHRLRALGQQAAEFGREIDLHRIFPKKVSIIYSTEASRKAARSQLWSLSSDTPELFAEVAPIRPLCGCIIRHNFHATVGPAQHRPTTEEQTYRHK